MTQHYLASSRIRGGVVTGPGGDVLGLGVRRPLVLVAAGLGFPLTQLAIARFGRGGAAAVEAVSGGLLARSAVLVSNGTVHRLRRAPAALLWLELVAAAVSCIAGVGAIRRPQQPLQRTPAGILEAIRRAGVGTMFGAHTYRYWMSLQPDGGLKPQPADDRA